MSWSTRDEARFKAALKSRTPTHTIKIAAHQRRIYPKDNDLAFLRARRTIAHCLALCARLRSLGVK